MDPEDLRLVLSDSGADLWAVIDGAIEMAARDHGDELRARRDGIVERLYGQMLERCRNCGNGDVRSDYREEEEEEEEKDKEKEEEEEEEEEGMEEEEGEEEGEEKGDSSPATPQSMNEEELEEEEEEEGEDVDRSSVDDQKSKILAIKDFLDDQDQSDESLASLLQNLADMDVTVHVLKETDIGRHVNHLRKHSSPEIRRLVRFLVRKWMETVDEFVKTTDGDASNIILDGDSQMQSNGRSSENGNRVPEFGSSPDPNNTKNFAAKRGSPLPPMNTPNSTTSNKTREAKEMLEDPEKLASATRRLQQNYQEASNAKKQRTVQMVEIHDIPKTNNNAFVPRGRGGGGRGGFKQKKRW